MARRPGGELALANAFEALADEHAVVMVEPDDVGDRSEGDQVEQGGEPGLALHGEPVALAQFGT